MNKRRRTSRIGAAAGIKTTFLLVTSVAIVAAASTPAHAVDLTAQAPDQQFVNHPGWAGVGLNLGNIETGVTAKMWASQKTAVQMALGARPEGNALRLNVDLTFSPYMWHSSDSQYGLPFYFGVGGTVGHTFSSDVRPSSTEAGVRVPLGMSILVRNNPVELFFEIAPEFTVRSSSAADQGKYTFYADGAIGVRYYL
jgi:hypothetical protein